MLEKLYTKFGKKRVWSVAVAIGLLIVFTLILMSFGEEESSEEVVEGKRTVEIINASEYQSGALGVVAPTADGNSFVVRAEKGGRVNKVSKVGTVAQGAVIAEIDNAAERAALLQAEGIYEAALAAANRSDISADDARFALTNAKESVVNANRAALTTWNGVLFNTVDELFSNPRASNPGVRIHASGQASDIGEDRVALGNTLDNWQNDVTTVSANQTTAVLVNTIDTAINRVNELAALVDTFIELLPRHPTDEVFTASEISRLQSSFSTARATLNGQRASLEAAKNNLLRAEESVKSAEVGATGGALSAADAQIKQALGAYRAAQASYNKSIVRAPFAGRITSLNTSVGDIINPGSDVAIIVPNEGVETSSFFNLPLSAVKYTPDGALVFVIDENNVLNTKTVTTGLVTASYVQVEGLTGEERIVKDVRGLKAGETVEVQ